MKVRNNIMYIKRGATPDLLMDMTVRLKWVMRRSPHSPMIVEVRENGQTTEWWLAVPCAPGAEPDMEKARVRALCLEAQIS